MQDHNFSHHGHGFRGTHVKPQGIVKGTMEILPNLPAHLLQGLFGAASGKKLDIAIRYANEPTFLEDDRAPGPKRCGMKVFGDPAGVEGGYLDLIGDETHMQDFTCINAPVLEFTDLPTTLKVVGLREKHFDDAEGLKVQLEKPKNRYLQFAPAGLPNQHFMSFTMSSRSAYRFGDFIAKYALFPTAKFQQDLAEKFPVKENSSAEQHSIWLREYFREHDAEFDLRVQLCSDLSEQLVEDRSQEWNEEKFPYETVARVVLHKGQDAFELKRRTFWADHMKLNVWYGLAAHRPLGSANRLRQALYQASANKRAEMNAVEFRSVKSIGQIP